MAKYNFGNYEQQPDPEFFGKYAKQDVEFQVAYQNAVPISTKWLKEKWGEELNLEPPKETAPKGAGIVYASIKGADGTLYKVPLKAFPSIVGNYELGADAPNHKLVGVAFEIDQLVYEFKNGGNNILQGPFVTEDTYQKLLPFSSESLKQLEAKPDMVILEHNGIKYDLKKDDTLTINMPVQLNSELITEFNEVLKVVDFGHKKDTSQTVKPNFVSPSHTSTSSFDMLQLENKTFVITGYHENKRYEIVLGTPLNSNIKSKAVKELFGDDFDPRSIPNGLYNLIISASRLLKSTGEFGPNHNMLRHPAMRQEVTCPVGNNYTSELQQVIMHLNDTHQWTREQIADWIDSLDEQPVYYPTIGQPERLANSAKVVALATPVQEGIE